VATQLAASQEGLSSMSEVSFTDSQVSSSTIKRFNSDEQVDLNSHLHL
jgi:hypothetical protein